MYTSELLRWANNYWKHHYGINIYEMGHNQFLFEFPTKTVANLVVTGEWTWKSHGFLFDWWSRTSNSIEESLKEVWIRLVGLPLQLWSQNVLEFDELCASGSRQRRRQSYETI